MSPKEVKVNVQLMNDSDSISNEFKASRSVLFDGDQLFVCCVSSVTSALSLDVLEHVSVIGGSQFCRRKRIQ